MGRGWNYRLEEHLKAGERLCERCHGWGSFGRHSLFDRCYVCNGLGVIKPAKTEQVKEPEVKKAE